MKIVLIRHGKPDVELRGWFKASELKQLVSKYNASAIMDQPPPATILNLKQSGKVFCSDLQRSIQSAQLLGLANQLEADPLFCEASIPHFNSGRLCLPIPVWVVIIRVLWLLGYSQNGESLKSFRRRAKMAADRLVLSAKQHGSVLLVGHGVLNYFIARELRRLKWQAPKHHRHHHWAMNCYTFKVD